MSRKEGGKGLVIIEHSVDTSIRGVEDSIKKQSKEGLIARNGNNRNDIRINRITITRGKWEEKQMYEYFLRQTSDVSHEKTWRWLRKGNLKRETESIQIVTQSNVIRTNYLKAKIDKNATK